MQTFDALVAALEARFPAARRRPGAAVFDVGGLETEVFRIRVGGVEEWAALTIIGGAGAPPSHLGMGAPIRCREGWALRLVFPVFEVSPETFASAMQRLACEVRELRASAPRTDGGFYWMWLDKS